ncbi:hypothetical protein NNC19_00795 [Clostridium sp. SHJSY1]|uniref:hypothetical protein n=1 Tax=Clostridium sp. SHJSY1 TaxID=2942483 RepID=UPI0028752350|nr:hypothetical protein [Clostridium sp. SHJSY1]MDS0524193.1 hypothetical protein [Clostridium sp. SHJSY1]
MKKLLKNIFYSESFKKGMIYMMFSNPRLTTSEILILRKAVQDMESAQAKEKQIELKEAA